MGNVHGDWIWYELMTTNADAAQAFYGAVLDWRYKQSSPTPSGIDYREIVAADGDHVGGVMTLSADMLAGGARPGWLGYIAVDNVDATVASVTRAGGKVLMPATDLEGVGRFALLTDPQGVPFYIMRGAMEGYTSNAFAMDGPRPGHCAWNELATSDQPGALAFYKAQFGWTEDGAMDMGPMGSYIFLRHGSVIGAVMPKPEPMPVSAWTYYFRVPDITTAEAAVRAQGGTVMNGPHPVPGDDWILQGLDPQGGFFALVGKKG